MTGKKRRGFRLFQALSVGCGMLGFWRRRPADEIARLYRAGYDDDSIHEELDGWAD